MWLYRTSGDTDRPIVLYGYQPGRGAEHPQEFLNGFHRYELGSGCELERQLLSSKRILHHPDGTYELFSQEAINGHGELARSGDFFKLDDAGYPYPNSREWFLSHHIHVQGNEYRQINEPLQIWQSGDPLSKEMEYLLNSGKLIINQDDERHYFNAFLWVAPLSAEKNATIVFYNVALDESHHISDITFNFVAKCEFEKDYRLL